MTAPATVLVYEFYAGGGCPEGNLAPGLASEALGMLWAILADFNRWGAVRTISVLDPRFEEQIPNLNRATLPADEVVCASPGDYETLYLSLLRRCDAVMIIAPETNGILKKLTAHAESAGIPVLGSSSAAVAVAGNKESCNRIFRGGKLPIPESHAAGFASARRIAERMRLPLVMKPLDGVGCRGVCRIDSFSEIPAALALIRRVTRRRQILLQPLLRGIHASVSLLIAGNRCLPLSLNRQLIENGSVFRYGGSEVPLDHAAGEYALELARMAASLIPGIKGYAGIDLVLKDRSAWLIEINPRLTTSYIALRRVAGINLAQAIWESCIQGSLPDRVPLAGRVVIKKDDPVSWGYFRTDKGGVLQ